jgi:hypothetical protein
MSTALVVAIVADLILRIVLVVWVLLKSRSIESPSKPV